MSGHLITGAVDPVVGWCLGQAMVIAREQADKAGLVAVGLVIGRPSPDQWPQIQALERFVAVLGAESRGGAYVSALVEEADVVCPLEYADLLAAPGRHGAHVVTGLPSPPTEPAPTYEHDDRCTRIAEALLAAEDPPDTSAIAIVAGRGAKVSARAVAAWGLGLPVVALTRDPVPELLTIGGALVAKRMLVGFEAADILSRGAPLRRALARRGQRAVHRMPSAEEFAARVLEAMTLASAGRDRTRFVSA